MASWRLRAADVAALLAAGLPGLWQLSLLFRLYLARFRYPMDMEWLEGAVLYQAHRVMTGLATYDPPSQGYLPIFHPPGYPTLLGLLGRVIGVDYPMARTVSLGCFAVASALVVRQLTRSRIDGIPSFAMGLWAVGCAAAGVPLLQGFYDLIREDVLALLFAVVGAVIAESDVRWRWWFGAGHGVRPEHASFARIAALSLVCAAIVYTRLPYVFFVVWIVLFVLWRNPKEGVLLALGVTSVCGLLLVLLQYATRGYYWMYTFAVVQDHSVYAARFRYGLERIVEFAPFVPALPVVALALAMARRLSAQTVLWLGMFASAIPSALLPFAKVGGFSNDFMPAAFFIGPATAWLVLDGARAMGRHPRVQAISVTLVYAGLGAFLLVRTYDLKPFVPSDDMRRLARTLNSSVLNLDGEVIAPRHPFVPVRNGKHSRQYAEMPYLDGAWAGWSNLD